MGFDPRQRQRVTSNVDALLAENDALRREVRQLRRQVELLRQQRMRKEPVQQRPWQEPTGAPPRVTTAQVDSWGEALGQQTGWNDLRRSGLEALIERLNHNSFHPQLNLHQRLDRLAPGLGSDLQAAVAGPRTKKRCAVLASFALYGVRSSEWLNEDPQRVVTELRQQQQQTRSGRRTRSDQRKTDRQQQGEGEQQTGRQQQSSRHQHSQQQHSQQEPGRAAALKVLGLEMGASQQAIKKAHRNLVKQHHPDMGGSAEAFRRVNEAYQLLIG